MEETWKPCTILPGLAHIWVSSRGNVKAEERIVTSIRQGVVSTQRRPAQSINPWIGRNGYYHIAVKNGPTRRKYLVHRLVALAFIPTKNILLSINHIDGNKRHNWVENLEWCSLADNSRMEWRDGLANPHPGAIKLNQIMANEIKVSGGKVVDIAKEYGISSSMVYAIRGGKRW